jgi:hypothetical protein
LLSGVIGNPAPPGDDKFAVAAHIAIALLHQLAGIDKVGGQFFLQPAEAYPADGNVDRAIEAKVGVGGDVAEGGEGGAIFQAKQPLGADIDVAAPSGKDIGGDVTVLGGNTDDEALGICDGDVAAITAPQLVPAVAKIWLPWRIHNRSATLRIMLPPLALTVSAMI